MTSPDGPREFATTHWSLIVSASAGAGTDENTRAREALAELCRLYWYPLYAFVRFRGHSADDARDLTQSFFARVIETGGFATADPGRGRFRSYLLGAMKHFLANEWQRARAHRRGGRYPHVGLDTLDAEARYAAAHTRTTDAETFLDREWALETVSVALSSLRDEMSRTGRLELFEALEGSLTGDDSHTREETAERLGLSTGAVKVAVHRLRRRYREVLRATVSETVSNEADLEDEMRHLVNVLRNA